MGIYKFKMPNNNQSNNKNYLTKKVEETDIPITEINLIISTKDNKPILELRRTIMNIEEIKNILRRGWEQKHIIVFPKFTSKLQAINNLMDKGMIYKGEKEGEYIFTF
jgi:hypothetical protein